MSEPITPAPKLRRKWYLRWWAILLYILIFSMFKTSFQEAQRRVDQVNNPSPASITPTSTQQPVSSQITNPVQVEQAKKELDEVMSLAKKSGLVTTYEFSDKANEVFVSKLWYTQTVQFKKDFMAKISSLKKTITGYHRFQMRDALSNEKVAEVTALTGSLEVYR